MKKFREWLREEEAKELNEGKIKKITKWENFVSKSIDGTGGNAYLFTNGEWDKQTTNLPKYFKDHPKQSVIFKQSGVKYEWSLDTGYIEYL